MRRKQQSKQTRARILDAANKCFARKGIAYTLISDIVCEAKVSVGTFYHYFKNKDDLIVSLFFLFDIEFSKSVEQFFRHGESLDRLIEFACYFSRYYKDNEARRTNIEYWKARVSISLPELLPQNRPYFLILFTIIAKGQAERQLRRDISTLDISEMVMIIIRGFNFDWANRNGEYDLFEKMCPQLRVLFSSLTYHRDQIGSYNGCGLLLPTQLIPEQYEKEVKELRKKCQLILDNLKDNA